MNQVPHNSTTTITFPSLEEAVSALCRATFGADMEIQEDDPLAETMEDLQQTITCLEMSLDQWQDLARAKEKECDVLKAELLNVREAWQKDHMEMKCKLDAAAKPETTPTAPPTYRMLMAGDTIEEGDEFNLNWDWQPSNGVGSKVTPPYVGRYRRPIAAEPQYRELQNGEVILPEDEWLTSDNDWVKRTSVVPGERLRLMGKGGWHLPHRRKV